MNKKDFVLMIAVCLGITVLFMIISNVTSSPEKSQSTPSPKKRTLDTSLPIYTQAIGTARGAMVCPITILGSRDLNKSPKRIMDIALAFSNRSEKIKEIGCEEWKGGLEVRMADSELEKLKQMQEEGRVGFLFFQNRPLNQGIDFLMIFTGDLTNNPTGEYGESYTPPPTRGNATDNTGSTGPYKER